MDTIALFNTKGGVGKSAVAVFLSDFLSSVKGKRVLLVDLDPQQSAAASLLGLDRLQEGFKRSASVPPLMWRATKGVPSYDAALEHVITRPAIERRHGNHKYLERVDVLSSNRDDWHNLNDRILKNLPKNKRRTYDGLLADALQPFQEDYDICLIDLPGHGVDPITRCGIRAADWWLFVTVPDWMSTHDVASPTLLIEDVMKYASNNVAPLGTVLSICQNRGGLEYQQSRATIERLSKQGLIPPLFTKGTDIAHSTEAKNALNPITCQAKTIDQKYGGSGKALHKSLRKLTNELLARLGDSEALAELNFDANANQAYEEAWNA